MPGSKGTGSSSKHMLDFIRDWQFLNKVALIYIFSSSMQESSNCSTHSQHLGFSAFLIWIIPEGAD